MCGTHCCLNPPPPLSLLPCLASPITFSLIFILLLSLSSRHVVIPDIFCHKTLPLAPAPGLSPLVHPIIISPCTCEYCTISLHASHHLTPSASNPLHAPLPLTAFTYIMWRCVRAIHQWTVLLVNVYCTPAPRTFPVRLACTGVASNAVWSRAWALTAGKQSLQSTLDTDAHFSSPAHFQALR